MGLFTTSSTISPLYMAMSQNPATIGTLNRWFMDVYGYGHFIGLDPPDSAMLNSPDLPLGQRAELRRPSAKRFSKDFFWHCRRSESNSYGRTESREVRTQRGELVGTCYSCSYGCS